MKLKTLIAALAFVAIPAMLSAQTMKENEQTSEQLKNEIEILKADIKALKARHKSDKTNPEYITQINAKTEELKEATRKKKLVDNVIKADKKAQKEAKQAEKAMKQNDKAQTEADNLRQTNFYMDKSNEMLSDELKAKIGKTPESHLRQSHQSRKESQKRDAAGRKGPGTSRRCYRQTQPMTNREQSQATTSREQYQTCLNIAEARRSKAAAKLA